MAATGCLASYGTTLRETVAMVAALIHANPGDTPAQQPTTFELIINLKTAKALDITVPSQYSAGPTRSSNSSRIQSEWPFFFPPKRTNQFRGNPRSFQREEMSKLRREP